jgi:hypothetical protein
LLLVLFQKNIDSKIRIKNIRAIERYMFVMQFPDSPYYYQADFRVPFYALAAQLSLGTTTPEKLLRDLEQGLDDYVTGPGFIPHMASQFKSKGFYNWKGIKYLLYEYELELKEKTKSFRDKLNWNEFSKEDSRDFYTVEHIYPQKPLKACWTDIFAHYSVKERFALRHSLGNLVPLSQPKNSSFQNKCFEDKKGGADTKVGFKYGSYSEIEVANYSDWTAREILERGLKLLIFMEKRWRINLGNSWDKIRILNIEFVAKKEGIKL